MFAPELSAGTRTQAVSAPPSASKCSISYERSVTPSAPVNTRSAPSVRECVPTSLSAAKSIRTGKLAIEAPLGICDPTISICFLYTQPPGSQSAEAEFKSAAQKAITSTQKALGLEKKDNNCVFFIIFPVFDNGEATLSEKASHFQDQSYNNTHRSSKNLGRWFARLAKELRLRLFGSQCPNPLRTITSRCGSGRNAI